MAKFIQICASQNDLFALDDQGDVHQYNFKVKMWVKLIVDRSSEEEMPGGGAWGVANGGAMPSGEPTPPLRPKRFFILTTACAYVYKMI